MPAPAPHADGSPAIRAGPQPVDIENACLVRLPVSPGVWAESLPPVPDGHIVSVSFSTSGLIEEHGDALALLGYRLRHGPEDPEHLPVAWMLVSAAVAQAHPTWWAGVRQLCDAVFRLAMGPALRRHAPILQAHLDP